MATQIDDIRAGRRAMDERADRVASFSNSIDRLTDIMGRTREGRAMAAAERDALEGAVATAKERLELVPGMQHGPHVAPLAAAEDLLAAAA